MALAYQQARRANYEYVRTEHILLGLLEEGSGIGAAILRNLGLNIEDLRIIVGGIDDGVSKFVVIVERDQKALARRVVDYAREEAKLLNHDYVGTEHILLGLMRADQGIAAQILVNVGVRLKEVREEVLNLLGSGGGDRGKIEETQGDPPHP